MLHCSKCGNNIEIEEDIYCPVCSGKVEGISNSEESQAPLSWIGQSLEMKVARLRERIAEARHNEQIGWMSVGIAIIIVVALAIIHTQIAAGNALFVSFGSSTANYTLANLSAGLTILAAILVILGVVLAIYSRRQRTRLLKELEKIKA